MKTVYIQHGCADRQEYEDPNTASGSNSHWIPWLQKQLIVAGFNCQTPELPRSFGPSYNRWKELFSIYPIDQETSLVGHSCGAGFLLKYLNESPKEMNKLILVAPWLDPKRVMGSFLETDLNPDLMNYINELHIFYSLDESVEGVKHTVDLVRNKYPDHHYHEFDGYDHFDYMAMGTTEFPELLKVIL